ncbi:hypothetical protein ACIQ4I_08195 [Rummeliibacillus sp. NPDC094406]|uniref:hypothetical protein n=1 Tax=Rummeliibacillus sp. NPDC094406 TaxID=3364511 RepID=UPI0037F37494
MKKIFWSCCASVLFIITFMSFSSTQASAKNYQAVDRNLKSVTLETKHTSKGYNFALKYPGKAKKTLSTSFKNKPPFKAEVTIARHAKQPTLIICSLENENTGWPYVDRIYAIKNGKLTKVQVKGNVGPMLISYKSDSTLSTTYYNRFKNVKYTYISRYYRTSNVLKTIKTIAQENAL